MPSDFNTHHEFIQYGTGSCLLRVGTDVVRLGNLVIHNQTFGLAEKESLHPFEDIPIDGIIGLGFGKPNARISEAPILHSIAREEALKRQVFSFHLSSRSVDKGSISFGGIDSRYINQNTIQWFPLISTAHWEIAVYGIKIDDKVLPLCRSKSEIPEGQEFIEDDERIPQYHLKQIPSGICSAAVDTGSSMITFPTDHLQIIKSALSQPLDGIVDCSLQIHLPTISIILRNLEDDLIEYPLYPEDYLVPAKRKNHNRTNECMFGLLPLDVPLREDHPLIVLGITFLQHYGAIFDFENLAVGLGVAIDQAGDA